MEISAVELKFKNFLEKYSLVGKKLLLSVSGGIDSRVLLDVAVKKCGASLLGILYVDHGTKDSRLHGDFVENLARNLGVDFFRRSVGELCKNHNKEAKWRNFRGKCKQEIEAEFGFVCTLSGHHATDLVETMLFRLTKGCGVSGLAPFDLSTKPFWDIPQELLVDYLNFYQLDFVQDFSNFENDFQRNLIRNKVLPVLREITPELESVFVRESAVFQKTADFIEKQVGDFLHQQLNSHILLDDFLGLDSIIQDEVLRRVVLKVPSYSELTDFYRWLANNPRGESWKYLGKTKIYFRRGFLVLEVN